MLSFDVEKTMLPMNSSSPNGLTGGSIISPPSPATEVKQEPGDERSETDSPIIRVCDSPESSNMSSPQSPLSTSLYSNYSANIGMPSPPPSATLPPNLPPIPNPFLFRPFFNMPPLPLLPLAAAQNGINPPYFTPTTVGSHKALPFSIDNILRTSFQNLSQGLDIKPMLPLGPGNPDLNHHLATSFNSNHLATSLNSNHLATSLNSNHLATSLANTLAPIKRRSSSPAPAAPQPKQPSTKQSSPPKKKPDIEIPVDLSKTSNEAPKTDKDCPPGMVRGPNGQLWPAWVFCTRYSDRPSSGPRMRKIKKVKGEAMSPSASSLADDKRPRTAFTTEQLNKLRQEFTGNRYLTEERRKLLSRELGLNENQIKIWFQNKRAKLKKASGDKGDLAKMLEAQGLYNHQTVPLDDEEFTGY